MSEAFGIQERPAGAGRASGPRAGFWRRFAALVLDWIVLAFAYAALIAALKSAGPWLGFVVSAAYFTLLDGGPRGQTLGKRALGIRVVGFDTGGPIGYSRGFLRWIGLVVSGWLLCIGYLWMLWDPERQTWADKFASDVVVPVDAYPLTPVS